MLNLWKNILRLALPSIATFSSMTFTGMLTLMIIGRLGASAIAVVGVSNILMYNTWALFSGIGGAINYLVSQNFGEGRLEEANERTQIAVVMSVILGSVLFLLSFVLPHYIFTWLGLAHGLVRDGTPYLQVRLIAFSISLLSNVFYSYMRGVGDTKTPMYISLTTNGLLVVITYGFTYGYLGLPRFGLLGAAWSLVITESLGLLLSALVYFGSYQAKFGTRRWFAMSSKQVRLILRESVKLSAMEFAMSVGMLVFTACITRLGTVAIAANEIALNILSLGFMPANGFGAAATISVGQEIGAIRALQAKRAGLHTVFLGLIFMALFSVFLIVWSLPVAKIYSSDAAVYTLAISLIHIAAFIQLFDGAGIIFAGGLKGVGDTTYLFRMSLILNWLVFIPMTLLMTRVFQLGQVGAWISLSTLIALIGVCNAIRYLSIPWMNLRSKSAAMSNSAPPMDVSVSTNG